MKGFIRALISNDKKELEPGIFKETIKRLKKWPKMKAISIFIRIIFFRL